MELVLNLAWTLVAAMLLLLWLRMALHSAGSRRAQFVALAVLVMVLFPVISVSDDLQAVQNPAEPDCVRRDHVVVDAHLILPRVVAQLNPYVVQPPRYVVRFPDPGSLPCRVEDHPALASLEFRPPPVS